MKLKLKPILIASFVALIALAGLGYVFIIGFVSSTPVKDGVFTIHSENPLSRIGANIVAFNTGSKWVLVDTHLGPLAGCAKAEIKNIANQPVALAFNSHWHPDHSGGNATFTDEANIVAHNNTHAVLSARHAATGLTAPGSTHSYEAVDAVGLPETLVGERASYSADGKNFLAIHAPAAHTGGDLFVFAPDFNTVVVGDLIWPGGFPFIDLQNGGSALGLAAALEAILTNSDANTLFIAGHGEPMTRGDVQAYADMVRGTIIFVQEQRAKGLTLSEIQAQGLPPKWQNWASGLVPEQEWVRMIIVSIDDTTG